MDNCCRSRAPKISLPYFILVHVCVKMIKDSVRQVPAPDRGCMYQKSRVYSDILCKIPQVLLKVCFQTKHDTGSDINYIYIREPVSLSFLSIPHQTRPRGQSLPCGCQLWNCAWFSVWCPRNLPVMLKEARGSYFKAFVRLIGLENSTDKSWG